MVYSILLQISLGGLDKASETSAVSGVLVSVLLIVFGVCFYLFKRYEKTRDDNLALQNEFMKKVNELQIKHIDEIKKINTDHANKIENIQNSALKREEERSKQWLESEKETLKVLNGVTSILEMGEKMDQSNRNTIYIKLQEMEGRIISTIENLKKK